MHAPPVVQPECTCGLCLLLLVSGQSFTDVLPDHELRSNAKLRNLIEALQVNPIHANECKRAHCDEEP